MTRATYVKVPHSDLADDRVLIAHARLSHYSAKAEGSA